MITQSRVQVSTDGQREPAPWTGPHDGFDVAEGDPTAESGSVDLEYPRGFSGGYE